MSTSNVGLSGDSVIFLRSTDGKKIIRLLKIFRKKESQNFELKTIQALAKIGLNKSVPEVYDYGIFTDSGNTFATANKKKYYVISEFMSNSVPLQTALITHCQRELTERNSRNNNGIKSL